MSNRIHKLNFHWLIFQTYPSSSVYLSKTPNITYKQWKVKASMNNWNNSLLKWKKLNITVVHIITVGTGQIMFTKLYLFSIIIILVQNQLGARCRDASMVHVFLSQLSQRWSKIFFRFCSINLSVITNED